MNSRRRVSRHFRARTTGAQRRVALGVALAVIAFTVALVLWLGGTLGGGTHTPDVAGPTAAFPGTNLPSVPDQPSGSSSADGLPALPGFGGSTVNGVNSTTLNAFGPGKHTVVLTATSTENMLAVAYSIRGEKQGNISYNVASPAVISRVLEGGGPFAAMAIQLGPSATSGSCTVTVDGKVVNSQSSTHPYAVLGCVG